MRRFTLLAFALAGCAVAEDPTATPSFIRDTGAPTTDSVVDDSSKPADSTVTDTGATTDTTDDTSIAADSAVSDSSTGDTGKTDSATTDSATTDTGATGDGGACAVAGCLTSSGDRLTCATARTIGRRTAGPLGGYNATITLLPASSSITDGTITCLALGADHAYKLFMRKGETAAVTLSDASDAGVKFNTQFWESGDCTTNVCAGSATKCGSSTGGSYSATADGWVTIMISGQSPLDFGSYTVKVSLTGCKTTDCECP